MLTSLLALLLAVPVVGTLHELGHALMARPAGFQITSFGLGRGRPLLRHQGRGGVVYYLSPWLLSGGVCVAIPLGHGTGKRAALYHGAGLLAQAALAVLLSAVQKGPWLDGLASFNLTVLVWNLLPWRWGGLASDGWWLAMSLVSGMGPGRSPLFAQRPALKRLLRFEEEVKSPLGTWYARMVLAWTGLLLGRERDPFFSEDHAAWAVAPELDALHHYVVAEAHRLEGRPLAALREIRSLYSAYGPDLPSDSRDLLAISEARTWLALGEPRGARSVLAQVAGVGGLVGQDAASVLVEAALLDGRPDDLEVATRRLEGAVRGAFLDPPGAVRTLWEAGVALGAAGRREAAARAEKAAQRAAAALLASAAPEDRSPLILRIGAAAGLRLGREAAG